MRITLLFLAYTFASSASADDYVTIKGQVKWNDNKPPELKPVDINVRFLPEGVAAPLPTDILVDAKSLGLRNVIVWLRPDSEDRKATFPPEKIKKELREAVPALHTISMAKFNYEPRIIAARAGDKIAAWNNTVAANNIKYDSIPVSVNVLLKPGTQRLIEEKIASQTTPISFCSNIYPWMFGSVKVFDHPYYAITEGDGNFEIKDAPVGKWRIMYWHERGFHKGKDGVLGFPIEVKADKPTGTTMELKPMPYEMPPKQ
jgi:hypothetical protein